MTEEEWERSLHRGPMLNYLQDRISERKFRLFAVACCRRQWNLFPPVPHRKVIKAAEQFADGVGTVEELGAMAEPLRRITNSTDCSPSTVQWHVARAAEYVTQPVGISTCEVALRVAACLSEAVSGRLHVYRREFDPEPDPEEYQQISLLHDIAGNPFRPEIIDSNWLTSTVVAMARRAYQSRDFSLMPILADALEDAGCDNPDILNHCRGAGSHMRGCYVIDLVLGKK